VLKKINATGNPRYTLFNSECTISAGNTLRIGPDKNSRTTTRSIILVSRPMGVTDVGRKSEYWGAATFGIFCFDTVAACDRQTHDDRISALAKRRAVKMVKFARYDVGARADRSTGCLFQTHSTEGDTVLALLTRRYKRTRQPAAPVRYDHRKHADRP